MSAGAARTPTPLGVMDVTKWFGETSGGVRTYLLQKQSYVARRNALRHVLVIPGARDEREEHANTITYRLRGPRIPTRPPYRFLLATRSLRRIVRDERPDVIEVGSPFLVPWLTRHAARTPDVPLVHFFHSDFPRLIGGGAGASSPVRGALASGAWWYLRRLDSMFRVTIVASDFAARELGRAGIERTTRVPLGVDLDNFNPRRRAHGREVRAMLGVGDAPMVLFAGRLAAEKSLDILLTAWPAVAARTGAILIVAGDGPERAALRALAPAGSVRFIPFIRDRVLLADVYAAADLYVSPGSLETFGLAALEALASGTPVLTADEGGVAELVARSGGGTMFETGSAGALADAAISMLREGDRARTGALGRTYAEREHAWEFVFERLFAIYRSVLAA